ncbi:Ctr copper transporter family [Apiospora saccharicola]
MPVVFYNSLTTPLFSKAWTPSNPVVYAATCIFILALGVVHQLLIAFRNIVFEETLAEEAEAEAQGDEKAGPSPLHAEDDETSACLRRCGTTGEEGPHARPASASLGRRCTQRIPTGTARALCEVAISLASYLLMLAVMTMNMGYFLSALGGILFGTLVGGRFGTDDDGSCH